MTTSRRNLRFVPGAIDTLEILMGAALFEAVLRRAIDPTPVPVVASRERGRGAVTLLQELDLADDVRAYWQRRA